MQTDHRPLAPTQPPLWSKALAQTAVEFGPTALPVLSGQIPAGLRGSLYRNGPGRLERAGKGVSHWFDGDGAILAVHLQETGASGLYRYVQTQGYRDEEKAGRYLYGGYGQLASGPLWTRWQHPTKNAANTSVLALPDRLLALWEGGPPHALDLEALTTLGVEELGGVLAGSRAYSAHPKRDAQTGEIWNFGVAYRGTTAVLNLYRSDRQGRVVRQGAVSLPGAPLVHDFALCGGFLVFCVPPVAMRWAGLPVLLGIQSYSDALHWQAGQPTRLLVIDREHLELVAQSEAPGWFQWHFSNGYEDADQTLVVDLIRYPDFRTNQYLKEVATGETRTRSDPSLWRLRLESLSGRLLESYPLLERPCEFATVQPEEVGQKARYAYLSVHTEAADPARELFGAIGRVDLETGNLEQAVCGSGCYPMEPLYAPDRLDPRRGWLLTVVFDGNREQSEVWIYAAEALAQGPVCRLALPQVVPFGFHGTWRPA